MSFVRRFLSNMLFISRPPPFLLPKKCNKLWIVCMSMLQVFIKLIWNGIELNEAPHPSIPQFDIINANVVWEKNDKVRFVRARYFVCAWWRIWIQKHCRLHVSLLYSTCLAAMKQLLIFKILSNFLTSHYAHILCKMKIQFICHWWNCDCLPWS